MTAKSRLRKRKKQKLVVAAKRYRFVTNTRDEVLIVATTLDEAKHIFQERFGYWPNKEYINGDTHPSTEARTAEGH